MVRLSEKLKHLEEKAEGVWKKHKSRLPKIIGIALAGLYVYGMVVRSVTVGIQQVWSDSTEPLFSWNPFDNIGAVFTPQGLMITVFVIILYCLFTKKGYSLISGYKTVREVHAAGRESLRRFSPRWDGAPHFVPSDTFVRPGPVPIK